MSRKYVVDTPSGKITRRTHRIYTHVVVTKQDQRETIERRLNESIERDRAFLQRAHDAIANGGDSTLTDRGWWKQHLARFQEDSSDAAIDAAIAKTQAESVERARKDIPVLESRLSAAGIAKLRATFVKHAAQWGVVGWAGRPDLAQKLANSYKREPVVIVAVPEVA